MLSSSRCIAGNDVGMDGRSPLPGSPVFDMIAAYE